MANGFLDLNGTPMLLATGTNPITLGSNGTGLVRISQNATPALTFGGSRMAQRLGLTNITTAGNETYSAAQLLTGLITRDPAGGARTDTTDTAAAILAAVTCLADTGDTFAVTLINTADAAEAITLAGGTGVTISNVGQTVAQNESAMLLFRRTSASALTLYIIGA